MHPKFLTILLFVLGSSIIFSCEKPAPTYLKPYYLPIEELAEDGLVYEYRAVGESLDPPYYWYYRLVEQDTGTFMASMNYNENFVPSQLARDELVESGVLLQDYYLFDTDSNDLQIQVPAEVGSPNVFPFVTSGVGSVYVFSITYSMPADSGTVTTLYRNRQYMGDTTVVFQGEEYHAIHFYVRELVDIENEGHTEHEFDGMEIYAKGIGLVYSRKNISPQFVLEYELFDRYPMNVLEEKFQKYQENPPEDE